MAKMRPLANPHVFHIVINCKRTSFSLDNYLAELLTVHLKYEPNSREAHRAITTFITEKLFAWSAFDPLLPTSRQARRIALAVIARPSLIEKHDDWVTDK